MNCVNVSIIIFLDNIYCMSKRAKLMKQADKALLYSKLPRFLDLAGYL